ncbi:MAG: hypothetical protein RLY21_1855 [Planctomycetota bacterium]|jgi:hypothetical protein
MSSTHRSEDDRHGRMGRIAGNKNPAEALSRASAGAIRCGVATVVEVRLQATCVLSAAAKLASATFFRASMSGAA